MSANYQRVKGLIWSSSRRLDVSRASSGPVPRHNAADRATAARVGREHEKTQGWRSEADVVRIFAEPAYPVRLAL
jgi:hypothetical protein